MSFLSVLAQSFPMIASNNDDRVIVSARLFQIRNPVRQRRIGIRDFAIVQMISILLRKRGRRLVWIMRIVHMHPHKMRTGAVFIKPRFRVLHNIHAAPLNSSPMLFLLARPAACILISGVRVRAIGFRKVVIKIETAIEPRSQRIAVQNHSSNKRSSLVATLLKQFRRGHMLRRKPKEYLLAGLRVLRRPPRWLVLALVALAVEGVYVFIVSAGKLTGWPTYVTRSE